MIVQVLDCDYIQNNKPIIRIFGKTENGNPVCLFYEGFLPYFYVAGEEEKIKKFLEKKENIVKIENEKKFESIGYHKEPIDVLKITLSSPSEVSKLRDLLEQQSFVKKVYEADILFKYRFMIDFGIMGMRWIEVETNNLHTTTVKVPSFQIVSNKINLVEKDENCKLKYLAIDIEALPKDYSKPLDPKESPIIMISLAFNPPMKGKESMVLLTKNVRVDNINVINFENEEEMLRKFLEIIDEYDPDIIVGYNINNFDLPFIIERLKINKLPQNIGRCSMKPAVIRKFGGSEECNIPGRIVFDPYQIIRKDPWMRFKRYDLNTVAKELLGEEKIEIKYKEMESYWNGDEEKLKKFIMYSKKDAELALRLVIEKGLIEKFFELSKISGLLLQDAFGGQAIRVEIRLLHEFKKRNLLMPCKPSKEEIHRRTLEREKYGLIGATVLEPKKGLYKNKCILVLDFTSLYPSIIQTYNISPDTIIIDEKESPPKVIETPIKVKFVDASIYQGVMPSILEELMKKRKEVKKELKSATGERRKILDYMQLAIKTMANSFYGYTGFLMARLYMLDIANAITAIGRENLAKTKKIIENNFPYKVIYADTDSVFLETNITDLNEAKKVGEEISKFVTESLPGSLELKFEKIYKSFIILTKKRYAGWAFEPSDGEWKNYIDMKGIETVRRDWCELVEEVTGKVIELVLKKDDINEVINYVKTIIQKLKRNEIPLEKLAIVKGLTKPLSSYKGVLPHIEVAKKMIERHPENPPRIGDRISFVIIAGSGMLSKRAESLDYAKDHNLPIDSNYYITSQILPPIERILKVIGVSKDELIQSATQSTIKDLISSKFETNNEKENYKNESENLKKIYENNSKTNFLEFLESFICEKCNKIYKVMPLNGLCKCGGKLAIKYK